MEDLQSRVAAAVCHFWRTRRKQEQKQGKASGKRDQGSRSAVTGGAQMDGFVKLVSELLVECGIPDATIYRKRHVELPGFFRPTKEWDLLVIVDGHLLASIEFKSQVGPSFGNNYNNRIKVFEEFRDASYAKRYELFCRKLVRERLYDAACFLLSDKVGGAKGLYSEPAAELSFANFVSSLSGQAIAYARARSQG